MSYVEKFNLCTCFSSVSQCSFWAFGQAEIAFLLNPKLINRLCVVHIFGYILHIWHQQQSTTSNQKMLQWK